VILDRDGKMALQKRGVTTDAELAKQIDALLATTSPALAVGQKRPDTTR